MKIFQRLSLCLVVAALPLASFAVTDKEMEEARTIATKNYLRYANNGSGYLDDVKVKTMEELEKVLKPKEQENLKVFRTVKVPGDYKSWDKAQLVEFWAVTAFKTPGLSEEGIKGRVRTKSQINAMTIAPPSKEEIPDPSHVNENVAVGVQAPGNENKDSGIVAADSVMKALEEGVVENVNEEVEEQTFKKEGSNTWVYVMILSILVAVVVYLVVFASNVIRKNSSSRKSGESNRDYLTGDNYSDKDFSEMEENFKHTIEEKNQEIHMLSKKLERVNRQNVELKQKLEALASEVISLRKRISEGPSATEDNMIEQRNETASRPSSRTIYLGRANSKGIFVRADRNLNPGNSVYKLETHDGVSGTFKVADSHEVWEMALRLPREYLSFGCIGPDLEDTRMESKIVNDTPGTAVFEGGCWRVTRKARIHYE